MTNEWDVERANGFSEQRGAKVIIFRYTDTSYVEYEVVGEENAEQLRSYLNALEQQLRDAEAKAALADEVAKELKARDRLSSVDALVFPRLTDYEDAWLARYDALATADATKENNG